MASSPETLPVLAYLTDDTVLVSAEQQTAAFTLLNSCSGRFKNAVMPGFLLRCQLNFPVSRYLLYFVSLFISPYSHSFVYKSGAFAASWLPTASALCHSFICSSYSSLSYQAGSLRWPAQIPSLGVATTLVQATKTITTWTRQWLGARSSDFFSGLNFQVTTKVIRNKCTRKPLSTP